MPEESSTPSAKVRWSKICFVFGVVWLLLAGFEFFTGYSPPSRHQWTIKRAQPNDIPILLTLAAVTFAAGFMAKFFESDKPDA